MELPLSHTEIPGPATLPTRTKPGGTADVASMLEGGADLPDRPQESGGPSHGAELLAKMKQEAQAKLQLQKEMVELAQQSLDSQFAAADSLALEVEGLKHERCV